jgi:hypothetical protein
MPRRHDATSLNLPFNGLATTWTHQMDDLKVTDTTVPGILESLKRGEWLVPQFQRDFVWSTEQVSALVQSILAARPIGMITLWEQADDSGLELERISIPDQDSSGKRSLRFFGPTVTASKRFAILDGRQRCTAIAMAFGGLRAEHGLYRHSGRYFLDVTERDSRKRVKFFKEAEVQKRGLATDGNCFAAGLFPLASNEPAETLLMQWMRYLQALQKPDFYPEKILPSPEELESRNRVLQEAFEGIVKTKLAVYVVPDKYNLADICEIFETLNTTGTKVSTVDLIHSWLYADTLSSAEGPFLLREWIQELGQRDGAIGWADPSDRPELLAQLVTACYVALKDKPPARQLRGVAQAIESVKAADLLATPTSHWRSVQQHEELFAEYLGHAQSVAAGGYFPWSACPYPVSMALYVALRWHHKFDQANSGTWGIEELDALFRAFFWRNALTRRYDQGFLTQIATDLDSMKQWLSTRGKHVSAAAWANAVEKELRNYMYAVPSKQELVDYLTDGNQGGALQKALVLPMLASVQTDFINGKTLAFPKASDLELHHIYPKEWSRSNRVGSLARLLDPDQAERDYVNSVSNLVPLSRESNNQWRYKNPGQILVERKLQFPSIEDSLRVLFIDEKAFKMLKLGAESLPDFWLHRAMLIADDLTKRTKIVF